MPRKKKQSKGKEKSRIVTIYYQYKRRYATTVV